MGGFLDREPDLVEGLEQAIARMLQGRGQRARIGAVAVVTVERDAARLGRKRNQRACRRLHLRQAAGRRVHAAVAERIVAAGIEQQQIDLGARLLQFVENSGEPDALQEHVAIIHRIGIDRHQIVQPVGLDAMAGVIEQRDVGADQFLLKFLQRGVEAGLVEIELRAAADHEEAERRERVRHQLRVIARVGSGRAWL